MDEAFEVPAEVFRFESDPIKGSRFAAVIAPAEDPGQVEAFLEAERGRFPDASHHCWAWRLGRPADRFRFSDDGEPGGSAGRPIHQQLEASGLTDAVLVVARWFGGTKLGVGGLMRAYGGCAAALLARAPRRRVVPTRRLRVVAPYAVAGSLEAFLAAGDLRPVTSDYGERIELVFDVPLARREAFETELRDRTAGRVQIRDEV